MPNPATFVACMSNTHEVKRPEYTICRPEKCISLEEIVLQLSPRIERSVRFVNRSYEPSPFEYCVLQWQYVAHFYAETTRRHDLSTRKIHLIRYYCRTAIPTNRSIRTIRETLLRPVSIRLMHVVAHLYAFQGVYESQSNL